MAQTVLGNVHLTVNLAHVNTRMDHVYVLQGGRVKVVLQVFLAKKKKKSAKSYFKFQVISKVVPQLSQFEFSRYPRKLMFGNVNILCVLLIEHTFFFYFLGKYVTLYSIVYNFNTLNAYSLL